MAKTVLITTAIVVHLPDGDGNGFTPLEPFADRLRSAITSAVRELPSVDYPGVTTFEWIDELANAGKCETCGCWVSDYTQPDELKGIPGGRKVEGRWLCDECACFGCPPPVEDGRADAS